MSGRLMPLGPTKDEDLARTGRNPSYVQHLASGEGTCKYIIRSKASH